MSSTGAAASSLPYHEPSIASILIISSFLLLLNGINSILDRIIYCGLLGQLAIGIAWGTPGADWLSEELQQSIVRLGYLGLILIVYEGAQIPFVAGVPNTNLFEGGISVNFRTLKANLFLSSAVALTGILAPIALSFVLRGLLPLSPLQCFAAGAALCSTSLGTTFTVLSTSGLTETRLGVVLSSAAMMDDVVGLIMVQIISSLGSESAISAVTIIRPVFVSIAFAALVPLVCLFIAKPFVIGSREFLERPSQGNIKAIFCSSQASFVYQTGVLLAMITGASYAGTSNLFAAYLAGASVTWLTDNLTNDKARPPSATDSASAQASTQIDLPPQVDQTPSAQREPCMDGNAATERDGIVQIDDGSSGKAVYDRYYSTVVNAVLRPFFFASIGFAIPITSMFTGPVIWRGIVYTILMTAAKLVCGLWLIRLAPAPRAKSTSYKLRSALSSLRLTRTKLGPQHPLRAAAQEKSESSNVSPDTVQTPPAAALPNGSTTQRRQSSRGSAHPTPATDPPNANTPPNSAIPAQRRKALPKPKSLYPAAILGSAMVSRGEIGFLISSVAQSRGVFGGSGRDVEFLIVTWAILLCTLIGPITVGLLVKRVRKLQETERSRGSGLEDPLGVWGVVNSSR